MDKKHKSISYAKWGYIFIIPFLIVFITCQLIPLFNTFYNSFFENYRDGLAQIGPNFVGFDNYIKLFTPNKSGSINIVNYACNTMIMWIIGAIPQLVFSLLLAVIFTSARLNIKGQTFFKTVIYMPNLVMASAFSMLFFTLFSNVGPINQIILAMTNNTFEFFRNPVSTRCIIAFINFLMWFGNTTILLMAGIMGIDQSLFEAASIDGSGNIRTFVKIALPLAKPIIAVMVIFTMVAYWNDWFTALIYMQEKSRYPLQLVLRQILIQSQAMASMMGNMDGGYAEANKLTELIKFASIVVGSVPMLIAYPFVQKYFEKGFMAGAVKG